MKFFRRGLDRRSALFWILAAFLVLVFVTGGSSRSDVQSLIILRPAAVAVCGVGFWYLTRDDLYRFRGLFIIMAAIFVLVISHLVPLPPQLWTMLPGREIIREIDLAAQGRELWRPISLAPSETWNAFYSLFVPLGVLVLAAQLSREERFALLPIVLGLVVISGVLGFFQAVGPTDGPLYLYRLTNAWAAVGLFANRNHQALVLAMCFSLLAVAHSAGVKTEDQLRLRRILSIAVGAILIPLLLVTGSRAGIVLGLVGLASVPFLTLQNPKLIPAKRRHTTFNPRVVFAGIGIAALALLSLAMARAEAIDRILGADADEEVRFNVWRPIAEIGLQYFPIGSGMGTFVPVYKMDEATSNLAYYYMNHAHNEPLELWMTGGLPALGLALVVTIMWSKTAVHWFLKEKPASRGAIYARLGVTMLLVVGLSSIVDYPLRIPAISCIAVIAAIWCADRQSEKHGISAAGPLAGAN